VQVGDMIHVSGQLPHDMDGKLIAPAPLDADGYPSDFSNMEEQMRATYANAVKVLAQSRRRRPSSRTERDPLESR
jgi:enamine deaminase RidA (YjgF/YER057c/UK114 family)